MEKNHTTGFTELHLNIANGAHTITPEIPYVSNKLYHSVLINIYLIIFVTPPTSIPALISSYSVYDFVEMRATRWRLLIFPTPDSESPQYPVLFLLLLQWQKCFFYKNQLPHIGVPLAFIRVSYSLYCVTSIFLRLLSVQFSSVAQSCPTLCDPMTCSTPSLPVHHQLLESTQTHVHCVCDAIQPSHPLSSPSPPALNPSIRVFSSESALCIRWPSIGVSASTSVLPMHTQD